MGECYTSTSELEEALELLICEMDASAWAHEPGGSLRPSDVPLDFLADQGQLGHLLFDVFVRDADALREAGSMPVDGLDVDWTDMTWLVLVEATYEIRDGAQREDLRAAGALAEAITRTLVHGTVDRRVVRWRRRPASVGGLGPGPTLGVEGWVRVSVEVAIDVVWPDAEVSCGCP